jgi:hypothetical protein
MSKFMLSPSEFMLCGNCSHDRPTGRQTQKDGRTDNHRIADCGVPTFCSPLPPLQERLEQKARATAMAAERAEEIRLDALRAADSKEAATKATATASAAAPPADTLPDSAAGAAGAAPRTGLSAAAAAAANADGEENGDEVVAAASGGQAKQSAVATQRPSEEYDRDVRRALLVERLRQAAEEQHLARERVASKAAERAAAALAKEDAALSTKSAAPATGAASDAGSDSESDRSGSEDEYARDVDQAAAVELRRQAAEAALIARERARSLAAERAIKEDEAAERRAEHSLPTDITSHPSVAAESDAVGSGSAPTAAESATEAAATNSLQEAALAMAKAEDVAGDTEYRRDLARARASAAARAAQQALAAASARALSAARDARRQARADEEALQARRIATAVFAAPLPAAPAGSKPVAAEATTMIPADYSDVSPRAYEEAEVQAEVLARTEDARARSARQHYLHARSGALKADASAGRALAKARAAEAAQIVGVGAP